MKFLIIGIGTLFVAFVAWLTWPGGNDPTLFDLPPAEVYEKLTTVDFSQANKSPFARAKVTATGDGAQNVVWAAGALPLCNIRLAGEEADSKTRVAVECIQMGEGAAIAFTKNALRGQAIALVDSTLKGYPYDPSLVARVALKWPGMDADPSKAYGEATGSALKMQSDMMRAQAEYQQSKSSN